MLKLARFLSKLSPSELILLQGMLDLKLNPAGAVVHAVPMTSAERVAKHRLLTRNQGPATPVVTRAVTPNVTEHVTVANDTPVTAAVTQASLSLDLSDSDPPTKLESSTKPVTGSTARARGTRLDPDWEPDAELKEWTHKECCDWKKVLPVFRDYWCSKSGATAVKTDWDATWRNWVRRETAAFRYDPKRPNRVVVQPPGPGGVSGWEARASDEERMRREREAIPMPKTIADQMAAFFAPKPITTPQRSLGDQAEELEKLIREEERKAAP